MRTSPVRRLLFLAGFILVLVSALPATAQDFRGAIVGMISDTQGGVLPGVTVTVKNVETNVASTIVTDAKGQYQARYLISGRYAISAQLDGFKSVLREDIQVRVGDTLSVDLTMEPGGVSEVVEVRAEAPALNIVSGVSGTTVESKQIVELPLGDGTAYMLTRLAPGIMDTSDLHFARPMDNGNLAGITANGVQGGNEFLIDGSPNGSNAKGVGFSPPSDAISEFKVQTNAFDAQSGHTAGAVVNLALKSGTNRLRGTGMYFNRSDSRSATPLLTQRAGGGKPTRDYNRAGVTLSGPIFKNKTFFMVAYEYLRDVQPEPATYTVPTMKMRAGDLSEFSNAIYDPLTATGSSGTRTAFPGNVIPAGRINAVAAAYAKLYPEPNRGGTQLNYFTNGLRPYDYNAVMTRIDHNVSSGLRAFMTGYFNKRREDRYNWAQDTNGGIINGFAVTKGYDFRSNLGGTLGFTSAFSPTLLLDVRTAVARFGEYRNPDQEYDPATLGFSQTALQAMRGYQYLPLFTFGSFSTTNANSTIASLGAQRSDWGEGFDRPMTTVSAAPTVTWVHGGHTARVGYDFRYQIFNITNAGFPGGRFHFNGAYTRASNSSGTNDRAQSWAQFLLGLPSVATGAVATPGTTSSQFEIASPGDYTQMYNGFFVQNDWRVNRRLTVNAGVRLEINGGMSEVEDRNLAGFDTSTPSPISAQALAAYAQNPLTEIPAGSFRVNGGLKFADGPANKTATKLLPRANISYLLADRTVVRAGIGLFSYDYFFENINQAGFSQATPVMVTNDNGLTFTGASLTNPLPGGQLVQPVGSALGLGSQLGQALGTLYQPDRQTPYYTRWEVSLQREFGAGWVAALTYLGSRGTHLPVARQANNIPSQYLSTSRMRDTTQESYLSQNVPNPFVGLLAGSTINNATVARSQLLRPYPQFQAFAIEEYNGSDQYDGGTLQVRKTFRSGNSFNVQYTRSRTRDKLNYVNPQDAQLEDRVSPNDRPNRLSLGTSLRLPFGREQKWGSSWRGIVDAILGGWQVSGTYQYQTGSPLTFGSLYYDASRNPMDLKSNIGKKITCPSGVAGIAGLDCPAWDLTGFYFHDATVQTWSVDDPSKQRTDQRIQLGNNVRYFPSTVPGIRTHDLHLLDVGLYKNVSLPRKAKLQVRFEAINALNYTVLWNPGTNPRDAQFGLTNQERNNPRDLQIGLRLTF